MNIPCFLDVRQFNADSKYKQNIVELQPAVNNDRITRWATNENDCSLIQQRADLSNATVWSEAVWSILKMPDIESNRKCLNGMMTSDVCT